MQKGEVLDTVSRVKFPEAKDGEGRELGAGSCWFKRTQVHVYKKRSAWRFIVQWVDIAHDNMHLTMTRSQAGEMLGV